MVSYSTYKTLIERFEIQLSLYKKNKNFYNNNEGVKDSINIWFSQFSSVNGKVNEVKRLSLIRLYLIKTTRGRSHALGKPSRGQRSWSNA